MKKASHRSLFVGAVSVALALCLGGCASAEAPASSDEPVAVEATDGAAGAADASSDGTPAPKAGSLSEANADKTIADVPSESVVSADELSEQLATAEVFVLDARPVSKHVSGNIEGSVSLPAGTTLEVRIEEVPTDQEVYIVDASGDRAGEVYFTLLDLGYQAGLLHVLDGGMDAWEAAGYETVTGDFAPC